MINTFSFILPILYIQCSWCYVIHGSGRNGTIIIESFEIGPSLKLILVNTFVKSFLEKFLVGTWLSVNCKMCLFSLQY